MAGNLTAMIASIFSGGVTADPYYEYTTLLLPGNGTNGAQNNTFLDSSTNNFTITRNGNTTQGTFSPFSQTGWGNYFNGSSYLSIANNTPLDLGTGDFTIEGWWYFADTSNQSLISKYSPGSGYVVQYQSGNLRMVFGIGGSSDVVYPFSWTPVANTWYHIAITRSGTSGRAFINGNQIGSTTTFTTSNVSSSTAVQIGLTHTTSEYTRGYVSNLRIVKGRAVYTSNFTPSTSPLGATSGGQNPPQGTETSLLTCQSNRFIDNSTNNFTITVNGSPSVQAFSPFNPLLPWSAATYGGSGYFDGNGDYLTLGGQTALAMGSGDFTIEFWAYLTSTAANPTLFDTRGSGTVGGTNITLYFSPGGILNYYANGSIQISSSAFPTNTWTHVAVSRASGSTRMFFNGVQQGSTYPDSTTYTVGTSRPIIGADGYSTGINAMTGYLSDVRILKGTGYSTITVPTAPLTNITNTSLLLNFTNAGIYDATSKNDLETVGNAQISTTQSKWGGSSMSFDGTGDWLLIPDQPIQRIGTGNFTVEGWVYRNSSGTYGLIGKGTGTTGWLVSLNSSNQVVFTYGSSTITSTGTVSATTWTHIAVVRQGTSTNQTKIYINGTNDGTGTVSTDFNQTNSMYVGADRTGGSAANAYMQDVRVTNYARYTANFTAPTAAFPTL